MTDAELIEELAREVLQAFPTIKGGWGPSYRIAEAILPIIRRLQIEAGEKVRDALNTEAVNQGVTNTSFAQEEDGWVNDLDPSYIRGSALLDFARRSIRALDIPTIIGGSNG